MTDPVLDPEKDVVTAEFDSRRRMRPAQWSFPGHVSFPMSSRP